MKRSAIVLAIGLPGALIAGMLGGLIAAFAGDASVGAFSGFCWLVWGIVGGACIGAVPGQVVGWLLGVRWVIPFSGGAVGGIPGLLEASGIHLAPHAIGRQTEIGGYISAASVLIGIGVGLCVWLLATNADQKPNSALKD